MSYAWEAGLEQSWEGLVEDENGILRASARTQQGKASRYGSGTAEDGDGEYRTRDDQGQGRTVCRHMIRYVCLVVDMSQAMSESDLRPSRRAVAVEYLHEFIKAFFDENPLSNLAVFTCRDGVCQHSSDMNGSESGHQAAVDVMAESGEFSLENGLRQAKSKLNSVPQHGSKEIIVLMASLSTCDKGDIFETIAALKKSKTRCSVIGLGSAEVHVAKYLTVATDGVYGVARNKSHLKHLIMDHIKPPPILSENRNGLRCSFIRMGFPSQGSSQYAAGSGTKSGGSTTTTREALCFGLNGPGITNKGFYCSRCDTIAEEIPCTCATCGLELVAASHLARSYHHLFPVPRFKLLPQTDVEAYGSCAACTTSFGSMLQKSQMCFQCPECKEVFCDMCEAFIHETLHNCPSCLAKSPTAVATPVPA
mmetsp:Transcript_12256/g.21865  ORF Transcript_12256/g.21865 Transcript_12256/m.21865 type:complete len:422 (+) Transcript_12256:164-1429(+)